jgi:hypothetical protein
VWESTLSYFLFYCLEEKGRGEEVGLILWPGFTVKGEKERSQGERKREIARYNSTFFISSIIKVFPIGVQNTLK